MKKFLSLTISDNVNMQFISNDYLVTKDSIIIRGDSDYGRTKVNYMSRTLSKTEKKNLEQVYENISRRFSMGNLFQ